MNTHKNARLTPCLRRDACRRVRAGARETLYAWLKRPDDVETRSSRPHHSSTRLLRRYRRQIRRHRAQRWSSRRIAQGLGLQLSTVGRELRRLGLGRLPRVEPPRRLVPYERDRPGELVHLDVKNLGRIRRVGHRIRGDRRGKARGQG